MDATIAFYAGVLGMTPTSFGDGRRALIFGYQKINLHRAGAEFEPKALRPSPGSADLCFVLDCTLEEAASRLENAGVAIEAGPVARTGALGPIQSIYLRDPDGNLIELACYRDARERRPAPSRKSSVP
jgi:catechol 2,3-dioxygenase-like lactoylglutathione lyase family enzyme